VKYTPALWALAGAAAIAIVVPTTASAVTSQLSTIVDASSGYKAAVDSAHRLRVAETSPANIVTIAANVALCKSVYTVPAGKTLIVKTIHMTPAGATGNNSEVSVYPNGTCTGTTIAQGVVFDTTGGAANDDIDLGPGAVVKAGSSISIATNNTWADVHIYGYLTP
jgi:hypothetical protein